MVPINFQPAIMTDADDSQNVARANKYFDILDKPESKTRVATEEFAVDSYQNLLFSILRFHAIIQKWPNQITLVSHDFKKRRFIELHCAAIRWPIDRLIFVGIDPPLSVISREHLDFGEHNRGYGSFKKDLYGAHKYLRDKREARGWTTKRLQELYQSGIPTSVKWLLLWEGGDAWAEVYQSPLPWDP